MSIFRRLGPFPQVFGQVKEWLTLKLYNIIRVSHIVAWPFVFFFFFMIEDGREECLNF